MLIRQTPGPLPVLLTMALSLLSGCSGGGFSGQAKGSGQDDGEDTKGDEPQEVSGAFLTCGYLTEADESADDTLMVGCGVYKDDKKVDLGSSSMQLDAYTDDGDEMGIQTAKTAKTSPWHMMGKVPAAMTTGYMQMTVKTDSKSRTYKTKMKDIHPKGSFLGTSDGTSFSRDDGEAVASGAPISSFQYQARWNGGTLGFAAEGVLVDNFCNSDGTVRTELQSTSSGIVDHFGNVVTKKIEQKGGRVDVDDGNCFEEFTSILDSGSSEIAHDAAGGKCLFVRTGSDVLLIIRTGAEFDPDLNLASLREFAGRKACH